MSELLTEADVNLNVVDVGRCPIYISFCDTSDFELESVPCCLSISALLAANE